MVNIFDQWYVRFLLNRRDDNVWAVEYTIYGGGGNLLVYIVIFITMGLLPDT